MDVTLEINGVKRSVSAEPDTSLLEVLRNDFGLTGAKYGCGEGMCGACTVLLGKEATRSCITTLAEVKGQPITTIEGLAKGGRLHPLQQAFVDEGAMQCGYCVPGMIMSAYGLLQAKPKATDAEILEHMEGNVCRCGGYPGMLKAIQKVRK